MSWFGLSERIDEIWDKIFFCGALSYYFFFVSYDDFVVGNFDNFGAGYGEFGVKETFDGGALDDDLLDTEIVLGDSEIGNFA